MQRYRARPYQRRQPGFASAAVTELLAICDTAGGPLILDSGCGTGGSTFALKRRFPDAVIIGVDKSLTRLSKARAQSAQTGNVHFLRLDLQDCWSALVRHRRTIARHYLLYPNPWPKQKHLTRRWHAHPCMTDLLEVSDYLEVRTNWSIYAEEFALAARQLTDKTVLVEPFEPSKPITAFEQKYADANQQLYRVVIEPD